MSNDVEFIKYDCLADGRLLKWLQNNLSTDNRLYISIFLNKNKIRLQPPTGFRQYLLIWKNMSIKTYLVIEMAHTK